MSTKTKELIFKVGFEDAGDGGAKLAANLQKVTTEYREAQAGSLAFVEAEKKVATASAAAGQTFDRQSKVVSGFAQNMDKARNSMQGLSAIDKVSKLVQSSAAKMGDGIDELSQAFTQLAAKVESVDGIEEKMALLREFGNTLPDNLQGAFFDELNQGLETTDQRTLSAVGRLRAMKRQLADMDEGTEEFKKLSKEAAELEDKIGDVSARVKALASDTKGIDGVVAVAEGAVGAFTAFEGAMALTGASGEDYAKTLAKVQGAMALLQGTQAVFRTLMEEGAAKTAIATAAQRVYNFVIGTGTGAMKTFSTALKLTGIGLLIAGVGLLAANWSKFTQAVGISNPARERSNAISKKAIESAGDEIAALKIASTELKSSNTTQERRNTIIADLQAKYPAYLKNIDAETSSYEDIEAALQKVNKALLAKASLNAAQELLSEKIKEKLTLENSSLQDNIGLWDQFSAAITSGINPAAQMSSLLEAGVANKFGGIKEADKEINAILEQVLRFQNELDTLGGDPTTGPDKAIEKKVAETKAKAGTIAELEQNVSKLRKKINEDLLLDSEEFFQAVGELDFAEKKLAEAQERLKIELDDGPEEGSIAALEARVSELKKIVDETSQSAEDYEQLLKALQEAEDIANKARKRLERPDAFAIRDAELSEAERHELALANIKEEGEIRQLDIQINYARQRLELLRETGNLTVQQQTEINNQIEELELQKSKVRKNTSDEETLRERQRVQTILDGTSQVINSAINASNAIIDIKRRETEQLISLQQDRVEKAKAIADKGNAELLQAEEKRLDELNKKREKFVRAQQALAAIQLVSESAIAIVKAAAEGGAAAPFTIAATLIALAAGLAQARSLASQAAFYEGGHADWSNLGGYTGNGNPRGVSLAQGRKPYTYHKQEYIMDHDITGLRNNRQWFDHIRKYRIDLDEVFRKKDSTAPIIVAGGNSKEIVEAINGIPGYSINMNAKGIISVVESHRSKTTKHKAKRRLT